MPGARRIALAATGLGLQGLILDIFLDVPHALRVTPVLQIVVLRVLRIRVLVPMVFTPQEHRVLQMVPLFVRLAMVDITKR